MKALNRALLSRWRAFGIVFPSGWRAVGKVNGPNAVPLVLNFRNSHGGPSVINRPVLAYLSRNSRKVVRKYYHLLSQVSLQYAGA